MTTSGAASRRKGADFERAIAAHLRRLNIPSTRTSNGRRQDDGDLTNTLGLHIECKNQQRLDLAGWMAQARADAGHGRVPVLIVKRRNVAHAGRQWAVLELGDLLHLLGVTDDA
jgi:hypothetical protein